MAKIVYNGCFGGFGLSRKAVERYAEIKGVKLYPEHNEKYAPLDFTTWWVVPPEGRTGILNDDEWYSASMEDRIKSNGLRKSLTLEPNNLDRHDPILARVVEELGDDANGFCAKLRVEEIPDGTPYRITEHDGNESVETAHSINWTVPV